MGCDISIWAERKIPNGYEVVQSGAFSDGQSPFNWRDYGMFGFLANVRNYSIVPPIAEPRGVPVGAHRSVRNKLKRCHSRSWLSVEELAAFHYDSTFEDRRFTRQCAPGAWDCGATAEHGEGAVTTFREFLGGAFFRDLKLLQDCGADRVVFGFRD